jgi:hypothetical protein
MEARVKPNISEKLVRGEEGVAMLMVLGFMALAIPMITGVLALAGTLSTDSYVKNKIAKRHYTELGCREYAISHLVHEEGYVAGLTSGVPDILPPITLNGIECNATVTKGDVASGGPDAYADIVVVLDNSGSISSSELIDLKDAANTIVDRLSLSTTDGRVRVGVTRFRGSSASVVPMTDVDLHGVSAPLHSGINGLQQGGPGLANGTNIVVGLQGGAAQFQTGLGDRVGPSNEVPNIIIFITDGDDTEGNSVFDIAEASTNTGAEVFAVGIGSEANLLTLNAIASEPDIGHVFTAANFDLLWTVIDPLVEEVNEASLAGTDFDIGIALSDGTTWDSKVRLTPEGRVD